MKYKEWIKRERRFRMKLLSDWPEARDDGIFRVCQSCEEICLCAEETCPNCGGREILKVNLGTGVLKDVTKFRCKTRYEALNLNDG